MLRAGGLVVSVVPFGIVAHVTRTLRCRSQVHFEFPEPTELPPPLIQLNDVSFQYPGRDDFGLKDLNIGIVRLFRPAISLVNASVVPALCYMCSTAAIDRNLL
jgi:hypothetical protein